MKPRIVPAALLVFFLASGMLAFAAREKAEAPAKPSWQVTGELEEACSCNAPCPCWFKSPPSRMACDGVQIIFITQGHYGKIRLDGLAVAQFVKSPDGKTMFESFGNWDFDNVYIDMRANEDQRAALKELSAHFFPPAAKTRRFRYTSIARKIEGPEHLVTVGSYGVCSGHLIDGGYAGAPKVVNPPLADPTHREFLQGETTKLTYNDYGQGWKYDNSNYMRNKFEVDDGEYAEYDAELTRKMAAAKPQTEKSKMPGRM